MTKGERVADILRREIMDGKWPYGKKLPSEAALCETYGVSRTSVRSAVQTLAAEGLIATHHGSGSFVNRQTDFNIRSTLPFGSKQFGRIDMFEFRRIFEAESAALAASRADDGAIEALKENVKLMQLSTTPEDAVEQDMQFHYLIALATENDVMLAVFDMLRSAYHKVFSENVALRGIDGYKEHLLILSAIESRSPEQARIHMTDHLNKSMMQNNVTMYMKTQTDI